MSSRRSSLTDSVFAGRDTDSMDIEIGKWNMVSWKPLQECHSKVH